MDFTKINWTVFLLTEKANLKKALNKGDYKSLAILIEEPTPEKEIELQKIVNVFRADAQDYPSEIKKEMETKFLNKNVQDLTPAEEAEWQAKLDAEKEAQKNKVVATEKVKNEVIANVLTEGIDEVAPVVDVPDGDYAPVVEEPVVEEPVVEEPVVEEPVVEEPKIGGKKKNKK
jgi:hypothetical protein